MSLGRDVEADPKDKVDLGDGILNIYRRQRHLIVEGLSTENEMGSPRWLRTA